MSIELPDSSLARINQRLIVRIAAAYAVVSTLWILASDRILELYVSPGEIGRLSMYKGVGFVLITALLLYGLLNYVSQASLRVSLPVTATRLRPNVRRAYFIGVVATLTMLALRAVLPDDHALRTVRIIFLVPVTISALLGGLGPGLLATALATVGVLGSDLTTINLEADTFVAQLTRLGLFVAMGIGASFVCESLHAARRNAEASLASQHRIHAEYRLLSEQLPDYVWRKDLDGRYVSCNSRFADVLGKRPADVVGHTEAELFFPVDATRWHAEDDWVVNSGKTLEREQLWRTPHREVGWVLVTKAPAFDDNGRCIGTIGVARDIAARRAAEEALRASQQHLHALFDYGTDAMAMFTLHQDGRVGAITDVNPAAMQLAGRPRDALMQTMPHDLLQGFDADGLRKLGTTLLASGPVRFDASVVDVHGVTHPVDITVTLVHKRGDGDHAAMAVLRDMSERQRAETVRTRLQAQVVEMQKNQAIGQLAGGIAHDFNNILASVLGYSELALMRCPPTADSRLREYIDAIRIAGERGRDLVAKMLTFARSAPRESAQLPAPLPVVPIIQDTLRLLRATIPSSTTIDCRFDEGLPPVLAERVDIEQILMNLVINSRDAMDGVGTISLRVSAPVAYSGVCSACQQDLAGRYLALTVTDTGPGIEAAIASQLFQPFFTTKEVGKGTGLGLSVVHGVVHKLGGHIRVLPLSCGACFEILLPLSCEVTDDQRAAALPALLPTAAGAGRHVIVVDDEALLVDYWREVLEGAGYRVSGYTDGLAALEAVRADPAAVDAVLTDQTMPGITGDLLAREVRALRPSIPIVLCSGYSERLADLDLRSSGLTASLDKPASAAAVLAALAG